MELLSQLEYGLIMMQAAIQLSMCIDAPINVHTVTT